MRGTQALALGLLERPDEVISLLERVQQDYESVYNRFYARLRAAGQPITTWMQLARLERWPLRRII